MLGMHAPADPRRLAHPTVHAPYRLRSNGTVYRLSSEWVGAIESYLLDLRAAGSPSTTILARKQHLSNLARLVGVADPWQLEPAQLVDWAGARDWMPETRRSRRTTFLSFYRWAIDRGLTSTNPAAALKRVRASDPNPHPVPRSVYVRAIARSRPREALMLRLAGEHGLRRGEIALVHSRDLYADLTGWSLVVHGKGSRERDAALSGRVALELRSLPEGWAFPGAIDGHLSPRRVGELLDDALEGDWTGHALRHKFAQDAYDLTGDLGLVQDALGHRSPATTRRYVKPPRARLRAVIDELAS